MVGFSFFDLLQPPLLSLIRWSDFRGPPQIPFEGAPEAPLFGRSTHSTRILGDLSNTGEVWNADF